MRSFATEALSMPTLSPMAEWTPYAKCEVVGKYLDERADIMAARRSSCSGK